MAAIKLKLVLCEKVTDDLMLSVTSTNQVIWQRPVRSRHLFLCGFFYFPHSSASKSPSFSFSRMLDWAQRVHVH